MAQYGGTERHQNLKSFPGSPVSYNPGPGMKISGRKQRDTEGRPDRWCIK